MSPIAERIEGLLVARNMTSWDASTAAGLHKTYLNDLFTGKKRKLHVGPLNALARVLGTTPEYLLGRSPDRDAAGAGRVRSAMRIAGRTEAGALRRPEAEREPPFDVARDSRFPNADQSIFVQNDNSLAHRNIEPGDMLLAICPKGFSDAAGPIPAGTVVVVESAGADGSRELVAAELTYRNGNQWAPEGRRIDAERKIIGVVKRILRAV